MNASHTREPIRTFMAGPLVLRDVPAPSEATSARIRLRSGGSRLWVSPTDIFHASRRAPLRQRAAALSLSQQEVAPINCEHRKMPPRVPFQHHSTSHA